MKNPSWLQLLTKLLSKSPEKDYENKKIKIRDKYSKSTLNWEKVNRITLALVLSTLFWILRELLISEQACSYTYEDFLHHNFWRVKPKDANKTNRSKRTRTRNYSNLVHRLQGQVSLHRSNRTRSSICLASYMNTSQIPESNWIQSFSAIEMMTITIFLKKLCLIAICGFS